MPRAARTAAAAFLDHTGPQDGATKEKRVAGDVRAVYPNRSNVFRDIQARDPGAADAFWYFISIGKYLRAQQIMEAESPKFRGLPLVAFDGGAFTLALWAATSAGPLAPRRDEHPLPASPAERGR